MMLSQSISKSLLSITTALLLSACGGGGGGSNDTSPPPASNTNIAPVANDDSADVFVNNETSIDVLSNDRDGNNHSLTITDVTTPASGSASISGSSISYTPNDGFIGSDTFGYTISDGNGGSDSATISINVINKPPTAVNDIVTTSQSTSIDLDLLANDSSDGGHALTVISTTSPSHGQISLTNNQLTYVPEQGYAGNDSFGYVVRDTLGDESTATVAVTVENTIPDSSDDDATTAQNAEVTIAVLDNDIDAVGDNLTITGTSLPSNGSLDIVDNAIVYVPNDGYVGFEEFTYTVADNYGATDEAKVVLEVTNVLPSVVDDEAIALVNREITIDVLANDVDVVGDELTIASVSEPANGIASIVENKIVYRSNADFEGDELIGYTVSDLAGDSASGFITVSVNNGIFIQGKVVGLAQSGIDITFTAGDYTRVVQTDNNGEYSAQITLEQPDALVQASLEHPDAPMTMKRYFADVSSLQAAADENLRVPNQDISIFSTAEYELVDFVSSTPVTGLAALREAQGTIDSIYLLDLAAAASAIIAHASISLPDGYTSINHFMASPFAVRKQLAQWRGQNASIYSEVYNNFFTSNVHTSAPKFSSQLNTQFTNYANNVSLYDTESLVLKNDQSGYLLEFGTRQKDFTWQATADEVITTFTEAQEIGALTEFYCSNGTTTLRTSEFLTERMGYRLLYRLGDSDIYLRRKEGRFESADCFDNALNNTLYDTLRIVDGQSAPISAGEYYFESIKAYTEQERENTEASHYQVSSLFNLAQDGSFTETIDQFNPVRSGNWALNNNSLVLNYDDGLTVSYQQISQFDQMPVWSFSATEPNSSSVVASGVTIKVDKASTSFDTSAGMFSFIETPLTDLDSYSGFAIEFKADNTGVQVNYFDGEWVDSTVSIFTWSADNNVYSAQYYRDAGTYVNFCDVSNSDCEQWRYRDFEVIGQTDDYWLIKNYQEWSLTGSELKSGYIGLYEKLPNR